MVSIDTKILNPKWEKKPGEADTTDMFLHNNDFLYKEVRGMSLGGLGVVTGRSLREITQVMAEKDNPSNIAELSKYVMKVKEMKIAERKELLDYHTNIATHIMTIQKDIDFAQLYTLEQEII